MSSPFSYELDERQIRIMLRDGEMAYDQAAWSRFEQFEKPDAPTRSGSSTRSSGFSLSISRSVIVPVFFLVLIGGLSATLFSFVDFRKKETGDTKAAAGSASAPEVKQAVKEAEKTNLPQQKAAEVSKGSPEQNTKIIHSPAQAITQAAAAPPAPSNTAQKPKTTVTTQPALTSQVSVNSENPVMASNQTTANTQPLLKKRKPKSLVTEEIPAINATSTNLNLGNGAKELELDLDLK